MAQKFAASLNDPGSRPGHARLHLRFRRKLPDRYRQHSRQLIRGGATLVANQGFGVNDQGDPMFNACYNWGASSRVCLPGDQAFGLAPCGPDVGAGSRLNQNKNMTQDVGFNVKWEATDRLRFNFDAQYVDSEIDNYDISVEHHSFANITLDATGHVSEDNVRCSDQRQPVGRRPCQSEQLVSSLGHGSPRGERGHAMVLPGRR